MIELESGEMYTLSQECLRNSFTEAEFWAYIKGETQKPHIHQLGIRSAQGYDNKVLVNSSNQI